MDRWTRYLFESHSEATLREWAKRLHMFRFFRAFGGHANDGDSLDVAFAYKDTAELKQFFSHLRIHLIEYSSPPPQPVLGISYPGDVYETFPSLIPGTLIAQPKHCMLFGHKVFVWCTSEVIKLSIASGYRVEPSDVTSAEALEIVLQNAQLARIDPPLDSKNYICPKYYPEFFI